jgi:hypothetical protein
VTVKIRNLLVGGVPANESVIRSWLRTRLEMDDQALEEVVKQTLAERGQSEFKSTDEALDALMEKQETVSVNGFKRDPQTGELMVEGRCIKAGLKEWANSAYPGTEWPGKTNVSKGFRKGLMATLAERAFVQEVFIGTGIKSDEVSAGSRCRKCLGGRAHQARDDASRAEVGTEPCRGHQGADTHLHAEGA